MGNTLNCDAGGEGTEYWTLAAKVLTKFSYL